MKIKLFIISIAATAFTVSSCVKDTCNGAIGNTFINIEFNSIDNTLEDGPNAYFTMETNDELPENYFSDAIADDSTTLAQVDTVEITQTQLMLSFTEAALPDSAQSTVISVNYVFGDRRNYISCQHPGSADSYFLELNMTLSNPNNSGYEISDFEWNEIYAAGHL